MKTFNRLSLPESIKYSGKVLLLDARLSGTLNSCLIDGLSCIRLLKDKGKTVCLVNVLSRNLKGKTDLHGQPYKPSVWVFVSE